MVVDLDAFDANADDLVRRAGGTPIRVASKSVRVPALLSRVLARDGFHGVLAYTLAEALWLEEQGVCDDLVVAYPTVDRDALARLVASPSAAGAITLMVDDVAHLDVVDSVRASQAVQVRVAIDVDAGLRMGRQHVGPKRSPLYDADDVVALAQEIGSRHGFRLVGAMTYEGQVAGVQDEVPTQRARSAVVRRIKSLSMTQLEVRRREVADALRADGVELEFWNAGGTGSVEATAADPVVTEVAAGSGLLAPTLFDHYQSFDPRPAAFFGLPVTRRPVPPDRHRARRRAGRVRAGRQGPAADALGAGRAAPDRARGRRRGADPADRPPGRAAGDRRPGVVPARQVGRAVRAHQHRPAAVRLAVHRGGPDLPWPRARLLTSPTLVRRAGLVAAGRPSATGRLVCVDGPAGSGKTTLGAALAERTGAQLIHSDDLMEGWRGLDAVGRQLAAHGRAAGRGPAGQLPALRLGAPPLRPRP